jgi:hypothetical protein
MTRLVANNSAIVPVMPRPTRLDERICVLKVVAPMNLFPANVFEALLYQ